jgi:hypothetical protein
MRYGVDPAQVRAAVEAAGWPQAGRIWCGLAAMTAVIDFANTTPRSQQNVADFLNASDAESSWGAPAHDAAIAWGPGFTADISRDVGTDPRAMAYGQSALIGHGFHQFIDRVDAQDATHHLIADVVRSHQPIDVLVFHGGHAVLVSAVLATADPITHPESVTALEVWDPGYGIPYGNIQLAQMVDVPLADWYANDYYWLAPYADNWHGPIAEDPDPATGPYTYDPANGLNAHLWIGHFVYIQPDTSSNATAASAVAGQILPGDNATDVSPDWAFNQNGALIRGAHGEMPAGYAGPLVSMTSDAPLPNPAATPTPPAATATSRPQPMPPQAQQEPAAHHHRDLCTVIFCGALASLPWLAFAVLFTLLLFGCLAARRLARVSHHSETTPSRLRRDRLQSLADRRDGPPA